jgi:hypothetical protein
VGTVDINDVGAAFVVVRAVVVTGAASDAGGGVGPRPGPPELESGHSVARRSRTRSSTEMTARPTVLPDGR